VLTLAALGEGSQNEMSLRICGTKMNPASKLFRMVNSIDNIRSVLGSATGRQRSGEQRPRSPDLSCLESTASRKIFTMIDRLRKRHDQEPVGRGRRFFNAIAISLRADYPAEASAEKSSKISA
jgi:hypothetical protein